MDRRRGGRLCHCCCVRFPLNFIIVHGSFEIGTMQAFELLVTEAVLGRIYMNGGVHLSSRVYLLISTSHRFDFMISLQSMPAAVPIRLTCPPHHLPVQGLCFPVLNVSKHCPLEADSCKYKYVDRLNRSHSLCCIEQCPQGFHSGHQH
jgi:hypothetical protein